MPYIFSLVKVLVCAYACGYLYLFLKANINLYILKKKSLTSQVLCPAMWNYFIYKKKVNAVKHSKDLHFPDQF